MGVNKLGEGNKDYAEGYAAGFAAGVTAWFAATSQVSHKCADSDSNVMESATGTNNVGEVSNEHSRVPEKDVIPLHQGSRAVESPTDAVRVGAQGVHPATVGGEDHNPLCPESRPMDPSTDDLEVGEEGAHPANITEDRNLFHAASHTLESSMDVDNPGEGSECLATVTEVELNLAYPRSNALESPTDVVKVAGEGIHLDTVTEEELSHVAPGCFVRVGSGETSYWVEIGQIEGGTISGMVHPELSTSLCVIDHDSCEVARFNRNQITALGCDRYCWC